VNQHAKLEMKQLRELFVQRLNTVDERFEHIHSEKEREHIKRKIRAMIANIDGGTLNLPQLADTDAYQGDF
jgi:hypothetical protein